MYLADFCTSFICDQSSFSALTLRSINCTFFFLTRRHVPTHSAPTDVPQAAIDAAIKDIQAIDDMFSAGTVFKDKESALLAVTKFRCKYACAEGSRTSETRIERECGCGARIRLTSMGSGHPFKVSFWEFNCLKKYMDLASFTQPYMFCRYHRLLSITPLCAEDSMSSLRQ